MKIYIIGYCNRKITMRKQHVCKHSISHISPGNIQKSSDENNLLTEPELGTM